MLIYGDPSFETDVQTLTAWLQARAKAAESGSESSGEDAKRTHLVLAGQIEQALADAAPGAERVRVKVPEGFAFYQLYPEQYAMAAQRFAQTISPSDRVLIIGNRSIGTTLSAAVQSVLTHSERITVRPTGHPFSRYLPNEQLPAQINAQWAVIVDEGPGLSGSTMVSVARALVRRGFPRNHIVFFTAHNNPPGGAATRSIQKWYATVPRFAAYEMDMRIGGMPLLNHVVNDPDATFEFIGAGVWRDKIRFGRTSRAEERPPAYVAFERPKYLVKSQGRTYLIKFEGFATLCDGHTGAERTGLRHAHGFSVREWIDGENLSRWDLSHDVITTLARHIVRVSGEPQSIADHTAAVERLREMVEVNARESGIETPSLHKCADAAQSFRFRTYGDGRMSPWEWVRTPRSGLFKVDSGGHDADHTLIGVQSVAWDVAGAILEWRMNAPQDFIAAYEAAGGESIPRDVLTFYKLAWAAFRLGMCGIAHDEYHNNLSAERKYFAAALRVFRGD